MEQRQTFLRQEHGGATVEFVALMPVFLFITFFILEISVAVITVGSVEKAVQFGVRLALVSDPAVKTTTSCPPANGFLPLVNCALAASGNNPPPAPGTNCTTGCLSFLDMTCAGGTGLQCDTANCTGAAKSCFDVIVDRMRTISPQIQAANVTIIYGYASVGYVGGPTIPRVKLTVSGMPYGAVMTNMITRLYNLVRRTPATLTNLPTISATLTGEDLSTAGAS